jgi:hypothetical protein
MRQIDFECECKEKFSLSIDSDNLHYEGYCQGGDEYCSCGGFTTYTYCPKCGEICEAVE